MAPGCPVRYAGAISSGAPSVANATLALAQQQEALPGHEELLGVNHPHVLLSRRVSAISLRKLGRYQHAANEARSLYVAFRARLGDDHPNTLLAMQSMTNALRDNGEVGEAIRVGEDALARYRRTLPDHPFTRVRSTNVAIVLRQGAVWPRPGASTRLRWRD